MRNLGVLIAACLISAPCQAAEDISTPEDRCSLAVPEIEDRASIVCDGVDLKALARLNELLNKQDLQLHEKIAEAEAWARGYREVNGRLRLEERDIPPAGAAQELLKEGKLEGAGVVIDQLIGSDAIDIDRLAGHHYARAQIFALQFDPLPALQHYASAYNDRPDVLPYAFGYAQSLHRERRHEEAGRIYGVLCNSPGSRPSSTRRPQSSTTSATSTQKHSV
jgi:hypothetical protein